MPPGLHFKLLRYAHYACLVLGIALTVWYWDVSGALTLILFFLPGLFIFLFLPVILRLGLPARCPCCSSPLGFEGKKRDHGFFEYVYRCHSCTQQYPTGVYLKREDNPSGLTE